MESALALGLWSLPLIERQDELFRPHSIARLYCRRPASSRPRAFTTPENNDPRARCISAQLDHGHAHARARGRRARDHRARGLSVTRASGERRSGRRSIKMRAQVATVMMDSRSVRIVFDAGRQMITSGAMTRPRYTSGQLNRELVCRWVL